MQSMITLMTDFGSADYFVPAVKGVILSINPQALIVDITHEIPPQDIKGAAFTLGACYAEFPKRSIHLAVVDPGVGSERNALILKAGERLFTGPDNGIFSYVCARESRIRMFRITNEAFFRHPVSPTFHGRDVFAPVAAWLSRGITPEAIGEEITQIERFDIPEPRFNEAGNVLTGSILHIDRFGNCITNFTSQDFSLDDAITARVEISGMLIDRFGSHFAQSGEPGRLFAYLGSAGRWEICIWSGSAAKKLKARTGDQVKVHFNETHSIGARS